METYNKLESIYNELHSESRRCFNKYNRIISRKLFNEYLHRIIDVYTEYKNEYNRELKIYTPYYYFMIHFDNSRIHMKYKGRSFTVFST